MSDVVYRSCMSKRCFRSKEAALRFLKGIRKKGLIVTRNASAYKCEYCNHWHLGHTRAFYNMISERNVKNG